MKQEKIKVLIQEAMAFAPGFRKNLLEPCMPSGVNFKVSRHQLFGLSILAASERISMSGLALKLGVSNQQLTRIMDGLVESGLAVRFTAENDRRSVQTVISDEGRKVLAELESYREEALLKLFESLTEAEIDGAAGHLRALNALLAKAEGVS